MSGAREAGGGNAAPTFKAAIVFGQRLKPSLCCLGSIVAGVPGYHLQTSIRQPRSTSRLPTRQITQRGPRVNGEKLPAPLENEIVSLVDHGLINHKLEPADLDFLTPPQLRLHNQLLELSGKNSGSGSNGGEAGSVHLSKGSLEVLRYYESINRIERVQRSRSKSFKHLWKLLRQGKPGD